MERNKIERINELARKKKQSGLTPDEQEEQRRLREEYLLAVRQNLTATLDNTEIEYPDGRRVRLGRKK